MNPIEEAIKNDIATLNFEWFERMKQFFEEEAKYIKKSKHIEYTSGEDGQE